MTRCPNCLRTHTDQTCAECFPERAEIERLRRLVPGENCRFCAWCGRAWDDLRNEPCAASPTGLHDQAWSLARSGNATAAALGAAAKRAAHELERVAEALDALPPRTQRRASRDGVLIADLVRNEAERARDVLHVYDYNSLDGLT